MGSFGSGGLVIPMLVCPLTTAAGRTDKSVRSSSVSSCKYHDCGRFRKNVLPRPRDRVFKPRTQLVNDIGDLDVCANKKNNKDQINSSTGLLAKEPDRLTRA